MSGIDPFWHIPSSFVPGSSDEVWVYISEYSVGDCKALSRLMLQKHKEQKFEWLISRLLACVCGVLSCVSISVWILKLLSDLEWWSSFSHDCRVVFWQKLKSSFYFCVCVTKNNYIRYLLFSFCRWGNWHLVKLRNLSKVTQLVKGTAKIQSQVCPTSKLLIKAKILWNSCDVPTYDELYWY